MAGAKLEKTRWPGIYRRGERYVVVYRDADGKQRKETTRTLDEARALKRRREDGDDVASRVLFADYAREWVERHPVRDSTRTDYRRDLERWVIPFIGERRKLGEVTPRLVNQLVGHLAEAEGARGKLTDASIRSILNPLRACLGQAVRDGLVRHNPTSDIRLPTRARIEDEDDEVRALTREQLAAFLSIVPARHRLMFRFLASTGLRVSELFAVQWRHLHLDGSSPHVKVRQAYVKGRMEPPKSRHGRRDVPLSATLVGELRDWHSRTEWPGDGDLVFPGMTGAPLHYSNVFRRVLAPTAQEAGVPWVGFHTFRHTAASMLFEEGRNAKQVQRWLGHHSPAFTLATYVHLLSEELDAPLELACARVKSRSSAELVDDAPVSDHLGVGEPASTQ